MHLFPRPAWEEDARSALAGRANQDGRFHLRFPDPANLIEEPAVGRSTLASSWSPYRCALASTGKKKRAVILTPRRPPYYYFGLTNVFGRGGSLVRIAVLTAALAVLVLCSQRIGSCSL